MPGPAVYRFSGSGQRRSFTITTGTVPGYAGATAGNPAVAAQAVADWMADRCADGRPYLTGLFDSGKDLIYSWLDENGNAQTVIEGAVVFSGEVSVLYAAHLSDEAVGVLLDELAGVIGSALGQTRVHITYCSAGAAWVLTAEGREVPKDTAVRS